MFIPVDFISNVFENYKTFPGFPPKSFKRALITRAVIQNGNNCGQRDNIFLDCSI